MQAQYYNLDIEAMLVNTHYTERKPKASMSMRDVSAQLMLQAFVATMLSLDLSSSSYKLTSLHQSSTLSLM